MLDFSSNQHDFKCKEYINSWRIGSLKIFCTVAKIVVYYYYYYNDAILFPPTYFLPAVHWWGSHNGEPGPPLRLLDLSPGFIICVGWIFTFALFLAFLNKFMFYLPIASSCGQDPWTSICQTWNGETRTFDVYLCFGENFSFSPVPKVLQVRLVTFMVPIAIRGVNLFWDTLRWRIQKVKVINKVESGKISPLELWSLGHQL